MTTYKVRFIKWAMALDVFVRMEDEERAAYEENSTEWATMEQALVNRAAQVVEVTMFGDLGLINGGPLFIPDNWDWEITQL